ncbi:MAG: hypothetical protein R3C17_20655 [Planctomycetaceae bacterium]
MFSREFRSLLMFGAAFLFGTQLIAQDRVGSVLPFPTTPMDSVAKPRLQDSTMKWPQQPQRLPADAPNILIVLLDDTGFGVSETFGGEVHTPTFAQSAAGRWCGSRQGRTETHGSSSLHCQRKF